jgi:hypothetical protein
LGQADNAGCRLSESERETLAGCLKERNYVWLVEITEPDLYIGNKSKVVDVLLDPKADVDSAELKECLNYGVLLIRFPEFLLVPHEQWYRSQDMNLKGHLPLFTFDNTRSPDTVW